MRLSYSGFSRRGSRCFTRLFWAYARFMRRGSPCFWPMLSAYARFSKACSTHFGLPLVAYAGFSRRASPFRAMMGSMESARKNKERLGKTNDSYNAWVLCFCFALAEILFRFSPVALSDDE